MPGHARRDIVREGEIGTYHCYSRCVQRAFLCGEDAYTGINYEHRRTWIQLLLQYQATVFAVDVGNYSILSNHQHLIARTRPDIAATWNDEEVAWRWKLAWPRWDGERWWREPTDEEVQEVLANAARIPKLRANLASLSWFLARWKEPIAKLANAESSCKGHFYEQRFGSREFYDDPANLCGNVYLDLNQLQAGMADSLEQCNCSAIQDRLRAWRRREAQESLEHFHTPGSDDYLLTTRDMEHLLEDCHLAPIADQGPSLLWDGTNVLNIERQGSVNVITIRAPNVKPQAAPVAEPATAEEIIDTHPTAAVPEEATAPVAKDEDLGQQDQQKPSPRKPTRKIHQRLQKTRRRRASDNPFLGMPCQQYLEFVQWSACRLTGKEPEGPKQDWDEVLKRWGIEPSQWCRVIEHFGEMFHRAVGHIDRLAARLEHTGRQWIQGSRACRDVFT